MSRPRSRNTVPIFTLNVNLFKCTKQAQNNKIQYGQCITLAGKNFS